MPDPDYRGGAMVPIEYVLAEGGSASGREIVHHAIRRNGYRWRAAQAEVDSPPVRRHTTAPAIVPTESYVNAPSVASGRESVALVAVVALLVAALVWGAAGMPLL